MTTDSIKKAKDAFEFIFAETAKVVVGQQQVIKQIIIAILTESNALLEGYPGLAKTLTVSTLAKLMDLKFSRIQGTPDLMPSDITGTYVLEETKNGREFKFQPGPLFSNVVLMDEINRATPKTQSALLEAMQERQVTVGNHTYKLEIVSRYTEFNEKGGPELKPLLKKETIFQLQQLVRQIPIAQDVRKYAVELVKKTRERKELIEYGASPRASIGLVLAAKANALLDGRNYVTKNDVKEMVYPILRHRIIINFEAERNNFNEDDVIGYLLK